MENTVQAVANKLSAWQASGGALTDPMNAPIGRSDQHLASAASTTGGPRCPTWIEMSAALPTRVPSCFGSVNQMRSVEVEQDADLSASAHTMMAVPCIDAGIASNAATSKPGYGWGC